MKSSQFINIFVFVLVFGSIPALADTTKANGNPDEDERFAGWTEEQYKRYEDSVYAVLYPPVIAHKSDKEFSKDDTVNNEPTRSNPQSINNSHVPNSISLDYSKGVGQIPIKSGTSQSGARTYEVPISVYPGMKGFQPTLSLSYNSQRGNSVMGMGWTVSGLPIITRSGKSKYYDGRTQGVILNNSDSFVLDGVRLIKTDSTSTYYLYQSEHGNIKAKGYYSGNTMRYFEVFYPNGNKGVFGYTTNYSQNYLYYPLMSLNDLKGNTITYSYTFSNNHFRISNISYNGASVEFQYTSNRPDSLLTYRAGLKIYEPKLLQRIICKYENTVLGTYTLTYLTQNNASVLTQIGYAAGEESFNPLCFYYGEGITDSSYSVSSTQLYEWYDSDNPDALKVVKGKFDYDSGSDGLISLPNLNPYWKHYRHATTFRHSQNRFDNKYTGQEPIFLYAGLKGSWALPMPNLLTESGFVDIICGDLAGQQEEYVIKINNSVVNNYDQIRFKVYRSSLYNGLSQLYTRTYNFPTVYTDADGGKSIQPKFYYTGDFNGDGKMEVLAVSVHQPFGDTTKPSKCYVFDLINNTVLYQNHVLPYFVDFVGVQQTDPIAAANNTDKLFVMDYDGDGKTDICHINDNGVNIYTFDVIGNTMTARLVATYSGLNKSGLFNRNVLLGEFNGDGLMDILVSPSCVSGGDNVWSLYSSKGNGQFVKSNFTGTNNNQANIGFIVQDVNSDGKSDLIKYDTSGFNTYLCSNNKCGSYTAYTGFSSLKSILVPGNINSHNCFTQLISLKDSVVTKYSFSRDDSKEVLATGMANSLGVVEKNEYKYINEESTTFGFYTKGYGATFPYVNIQEPLPVLAISETFMNGNKIDDYSFTYENAVIHRQGLGFCGFGEVTTYNNKQQPFVRTYDPYRFGVLVSEDSPYSQLSNTYTVNVASNKVAHVLLNQSIKTNLLKGVSDTISFVYDTYGYPTSELNRYTGGINVSIQNIYSHHPTVSNGYYLGFLTSKETTTTRNGSSYVERMYIPAHSNCLPDVIVNYKDGHRVKQVVYSYDSYGNPLTERVTPYSQSGQLVTSYTYDSHGRVTKKIDPLGLVNKFNYDSSGRLASIEDHRGGITTLGYDAFGRILSFDYPNNTSKIKQFSWSPTASNGLFAVATIHTGRPAITQVFDALNREVRSTETRFDGSISNIDRQYDEYGRLKRVSLPFIGEAPLFWNTYGYDVYDRIRSIEEASGRETSYSYSGNSITTTRDNISTTKNYDALGNLISVTDPAGTISYNLSADGQPSSITAPGNITTSFVYDEYRRQTGMNDPGFGLVTREYDASGNISKESFVNGNSEQYEYDAYNRLIRSTSIDLTTSYTYNENNELTGVSNNNGSSMSFTYDNYGNLASFRENGKDGKWLQKDYTYASGNVNSTTYSSQSGELATENYYYSNGHLNEVKLNGTTSIFKLEKENALGQPTEVVTGKIKRKYDYTPYGMQSGQSAMDTVSLAGYQNISYNYDIQTSNLLFRTDSLRNFTESFGYDNMNRLISYGDETATYDIKGNITEKSDIGSFNYGITSKPYALSEATPASDAIPNSIQEVIYTSFNRPMDIMEGIYSTELDYNSNHDRIKMRVLGSHNTPMLTRHYLGGCYEYDQTPSIAKEKLYLMGGYYNAPAVLIKQGDSIAVYNILRDHLASITHVIDPNGMTIQELAYDAWGRLRNPVTHEVYSPDQEPELFLGRGFTGHEHLPWYGLINMNARLYDPALGRFLSPDPILYSPCNSQSYNSYTYCMNNPLRYVDPLGLMDVDHEPFITEDGEVITMHGILDEVVITHQRNNTNYNLSFDGIFSFYFSGSWSFYAGNSYGFPEDRNNSITGGGSGGTSLGKGSSSAQMSFYNIPPKPNISNPFDFSKFLGVTSSSISYVSYLMKDSKATYAFEFDKQVELPLLRVSRYGGVQYRGQIHRVANLSNKLSGVASFLSLSNAFVDFKSAYYKGLMVNDIDSALRYGTDGIVDLISMVPHPAALLFSLSWNLGLKELYWKSVYYDRDNIILPQYYNGTLGLPSTLPYK